MRIRSLLEHKAWQQFGSTDLAPSNMCALIVTACLIELSQNINSDANLAIIMEFLQTEHNLRKGIGDISYAMSLDLLTRIKASCTANDKEGLEDFLNYYSAMVESKEEQREIDNMFG